MSDWLEIHGLADEQLSPEEKLRVEERLRSCDRSRRELEAIQSVKSALGSRQGSVTCGETWQRCVRRLDEMDKANRIESFVGRYAWGICSLFLVFIFGAAMFNRSGTPSMGTDDVPRMAASLTPFLSAPRSQSTSDLVQFTREKAGPAPVRVQTREVTVYRGGSAVIDGRHHVRLDMADEVGPVTVYAVQGASIVGVEPIEGHAPFYRGVVNGHNCIAWADGAYSVMLIADRPIAELCDFAESALAR